MATGTIQNGDYTQADDSNNDWVIKDPQGTIILRYDESNTEWNVENNAFVNLSSVSTDSVSTSEVTGGVTSKPITNFEGSGLSVDASGNLNGGVTQVATGTVTATGGASPAVNTSLTNVSTDQLLEYDFWVYVDADPSFDSDYAFNFDYGHSWDDANGELDIDLVVNWDTDPGNGNDVTLRWEVIN